MSKSTIFTIASISCAVAAVTATVPAAIKTKEAIDNINYEWLATHKDGLIPKKELIKQVAKETWKWWLPVGVAAGSAIAFPIAAHCTASSALKSAKAGEIAAIAAYNVAQTGYDTYKSKVIDKFGENAHNEIKKEVVEEKIQKEYEESKKNNNDIVIHETGDGDELFLDLMTGRYFRSSQRALLDAASETERLLIQNGEIELNDFFDFANLDHILLGDSLGVRMDEYYRGTFKGNFSCSEHADTPWGEPIHAIEYIVEAL